jgi:hypothetical protein
MSAEAIVHKTRWIVTGVLATALLAAGSTSRGQTPVPQVAGRPPNFTGIWQALTTANWNIEDHQAELGIPGGQGIVEGGEIPYKPDTAAKKAENFKNRQTLDPEHRCYMPGVPRFMYLPFPFQILQSEKFIMMVSEYAHTVRRIHLDGSGHPEGFPGSWMGDSRARWDRNTLVIDTTNFTDQTWFDGSGNFHGVALHVVERLSLRGRDHLDYEATIEDPKVFTRPWKIRFPLYRRVEQNVQLLEYPCVSFLEDEYVERGKRQ